MHGTQMKPDYPGEGVSQVLSTATLLLPDTLSLQLWYPRLDGQVKHLQVGLSDTRGADDIRISYDFDRDGWKIEQAAVFEWDADDPVCDPEWREVAFVKSWARQRIPPPGQTT